jgi:hypothetical protein
MGQAFRGVPQDLDPSGSQLAGAVKPCDFSRLNRAGFVSPACALGYPRRGQRQIPNEATSSEAGPTSFGASSTEVQAVWVQIAAAFSWFAIDCAQSVAFLVQFAASYACFAADCSKSAAACGKLHRTAPGTLRTDHSPPGVWSRSPATWSSPRGDALIHRQMAQFAASLTWIGRKQAWSAAICVQFWGWFGARRRGSSRIATVRAAPGLALDRWHRANARAGAFCACWTGCRSSPGAAFRVRFGSELARPARDDNTVQHTRRAMLPHATWMWGCVGCGFKSCDDAFFRPLQDRDLTASGGQRSRAV